MSVYAHLLVFGPLVICGIFWLAVGVGRWLARSSQELPQ